MLYTIENEYLKVSVNDFGAELFSLYSKATNTEYLWQGDDTHWKDRAINLFPFIGRMYENRFLYEGRSYPSRPHGLARYFPSVLESKTDDTLVFLFTDNEETRKEYPFSFAFRVIFELKGYALTIRYEVTNTDEKPLPCAFGGHPGFNVPFGKGSFEDYYLEFSAPTTARRQLLSASDRYMANEAVAYPLVDGVKIPLKHELFNHDAIILENTSGEVAIKSAKESRYLSMRYDGFPFIGFWQAYADDTPYVCLEPWTALPATDGIVTELEKNPLLTKVAPTQKASASYCIEIHE